MITIRITRMAAIFETQTEVRPTKLYVGALEWEQLRDLVEYHDFRFEKYVNGDRRPEYRGMKVYPVDEDSYLAVGE